MMMWKENAQLFTTSSTRILTNLNLPTKINITSAANSR